MQTTVEGAPVIVKSVSFVLLVFVSEKNVVEEASGRAFTSMVTPEAGITEVIVTLSGKVGPGEGNSVLPFAGVVVMARVASVAQLSVFFFLQDDATVRTKRIASIDIVIFFIDIFYNNYNV